jgi:TonB family protein
MSTWEFLRHLGPLTVMSSIVIAGLGLVALVTIVALRFVRRGATRFWLAPALVSAMLIPTVAGVGFAAQGVRNVAELAGRLGSGVALAAGLVESQVPLLVGLASTALVACAAVALVAFCTTKGPSPESPALGGGAAAAGALGVGLIVALALLLELGSLASALDNPQRTLAYATVLTWIAGGLLALLLVALLVSAATAPATPAPGLVKLVAFLVPSGIALGSTVLGVAGVGYTHYAMQRVMAGEVPAPMGSLAAELPPPPEQLPVPAEATPPPPPPPPPPPRPRRRDVRPPSPAAAPRAQSPPRPVRVGGNIKEPRKLKNVNPVYPDIAKQARVQGIVILECVIGPRGDVTEVRVLRGIPLLDQAAIDAVKQWVYTPTLLNGLPVPVIMTVTVNFSLGG